MQEMPAQRNPVIATFVPVFMIPQVYHLSNGLRVLHLHYPEAEVAHCAFMINSGTRDEPEAEEGIAHFTEHAIFKGTKKRKAFHILTRIDAVGGELNAYTAKEETALHASFPSEHSRRALELLSDIILDSSFPEKEVIKERAVILDEINSYLDSPSEQIYDDFEELIFHGHPISRNILGTAESLGRIGKNEIQRFFTEHYTPENMVFTYAGPANRRVLTGWLERFAGRLDRKRVNHSRQSFTNYRAERKLVNKPVNLAHLYLGNIACHQYHPDRMPFVLLNNLLGGPAMNSRLNLNIRERYGFTYTIESSYSAYTDSGIWGIYAATDPQYLGRLQELIMKELRKLRENRLGTLQLSQAKQQLYGQLALARENRLGLMLALGKTMLHKGQLESLQEIVEKIRKTTSSKILELSNEVFEEQNLSTLIYQPS